MPKAPLKHQMTPAVKHAGYTKLCDCHEPAMGHNWDSDTLRCRNTIEGTRCAKTWGSQQNKPTPCKAVSKARDID